MREPWTQPPPSSSPVPRLLPVGGDEGPCGSHSRTGRPRLRAPRSESPSFGPTPRDPPPQGSLVSASAGLLPGTAADVAETCVTTPRLAAPREAAGAGGGRGRRCGEAEARAWSRAPGSPAAGERRGEGRPESWGRLVRKLSRQPGLSISPPASGAVGEVWGERTGQRVREHSAGPGGARGGTGSTSSTPKAGGTCDSAEVAPRLGGGGAVASSWAGAERPLADGRLTPGPAPGHWRSPGLLRGPLKVPRAQGRSWVFGVLAELGMAAVAGGKTSPDCLLFASPPAQRAAGRVRVVSHSSSCFCFVGRQGLREERALRENAAVGPGEEGTEDSDGSR